LELLDFALEEVLPVHALVLGRGIGAGELTTGDDDPRALLVLDEDRNEPVDVLEQESSTIIADFCDDLPPDIGSSEGRHDGIRFLL